MSEPITPLGGARFHGIARIRDCGVQGMITLRGDLGSDAVAKALDDVLGSAVPERGTITGDRAAAWMSPDELLLLCPYADAPALAGRLSAALSGSFAMAVDVSDARAMLSVSGVAAREVMAKLTPADLSPDTIASGSFRRSRLAQVPAAFWMEEDGSFRVICFRSVAEYLFTLLKTAAQPGSAVGYY